MLHESRFSTPHRPSATARSGIPFRYHRCIRFPHPVQFSSKEFQVSQAKNPASPLDHSAATAQSATVRRPLRIALFGFGTVGSSVARILVESKPQGLELTHIFNRGVSRKRVSWVPANVVWSEDADVVMSSDVDVIVELAGGLDPAGNWVRSALQAGKSVVTANKKLIARSEERRVGKEGRSRWSPD